MMKCPGCSKHCCENAPRCKYGRAYFAKHQQKTEESQPRFKWETKVTNGELIWKLLFVNRKVKKAVCKGLITEKQLLSALSPEEQTALYTALEKLENTVCIQK